MKGLFKKKTFFHARTMMLLCLSFLFMYLDTSNALFQRWRSTASVVVVPVEYLVSAPVRLVQWLSGGMSRQRELLAENAKLRAHEFLLESKLKNVLVLEQENQQLRHLLRSKARAKDRIQVADVLAIDTGPALQQMVVDLGHSSGIYVGQPVLDAYGVMGQIVDVGPLTSRLLMITDRHNATPVMDHRTGVRAIAVGRGRRNLISLLYVDPHADIRVGDLFVTSGVGMHYPVGYPVAVVQTVHASADRQSLDVTLSPAAHDDQTQQVILVWPSQAALSKEVAAQLQKPLSQEVIHAQ